MNFIQPRLCKFLYVVLFITGLLSCSKGGIAPDVPKDNIPMEFTTSVSWGVKSNSLVNNTDDLQAYPVSLLAKATVNDNEFSVFNNDRLYYSDGEWKYDVTRYWILGAKYYFAAFAPFASTGNYDGGNKLSNGNVSFTDGTSPVLKITGYNTILNQSNPAIDARTEDLMVAHYVRDNTSSKDYSAVLLTFDHILSCVTFSIRNTTNTDITKLSDIKLNGLKYKCDITLDATEVKVVQSNDADTPVRSADRMPEAGATPFLPKGMSENDYKPLFDCEYLTLLPQILYEKNDINLTFNVHRGTSNNDVTSYSLNLGKVESIKEWKAGRKYTYTMSITSTDILFQVVEVPWIEHDVEL